ncbi:hypothetical protein JCGZ_05188 [Jatropha curcas]|uniref:Uncharacterized protein n=1 Tax=Jatropha curcas TaxID=180498 RepID=A0A067KQB1_JATCU|nr:hypothetical protein JCGZ_05188 [Jatropha curcas]
MGSYSDEDIQVLADQSRDEYIEVVEFRVDEARDRKENIGVADIPSDMMKASSLTYALRGFGILDQWSNDPMRHLPASPTPKDQQHVDLIKARGLRSVNLRQVIAESYSVYSPTRPLRPHPSPSGMASKKVKVSKMSKVAEAMKRKVEVEASDKGVPLMILDPQSIKGGAASEFTQANHTPISSSIESSKKRPNAHQFECMDDLAKRDFVNQCLFQALNANNLRLGRITKLKGAYTTTEVKKNELEDALKSIDTTMKDFFESIKILEAENREGEDELQRLRDQEGSMEEDLAKACLSLRSNILAKLKAWDPEKDWSWVNEIYPDDEEEEEEELAGDTPVLGDPLSTSPIHQDPLSRGPSIDPKGEHQRGT